MISDDTARLTQLPLGFDAPVSRADKDSGFNDPAFASNKSLPIHRWVPWIAGFSSEFVSGALDRILPASGGRLLDPFAGVGTTLVEGMLRGYDVIGFEINPYPFLAAQTKLNIPANPASARAPEAASRTSMMPPSEKSFSITWMTCCTTWNGSGVGSLTARAAPASSNWSRR